MLKPFLNRCTLMALFGTVAVINLTACSNKNTAKLSNPTASTALTLPVATAAEPPVKPQEPAASPPVKQPQPSSGSDSYQQAIDIATGAVTISQSAQGRADWSLVANHWQKSINLLKAVPASNRYYKTAQKKVTEYKGYLADANLKATPAPSKPCTGETNPGFFSIPIKGRLDGTPIVEVTFNDHQKFDMLFDTGASKTLITEMMAASLRLPVAGIGTMQVADGSVVIMPIALVQSQEIDGRFRMDVPVAVAPEAAEFGLLGQDFYKGYDVAIKEDVIEFRRRSSQRSHSAASKERSHNQKKAACLVESNPKYFTVPITGRKHNIPIVKVTFNDNYTFPLLFDTGASGTVITLEMAEKMRLMPVGVTNAQVADGSVASYVVAQVKSQKIASRVKRDMEVMVAPAAMDVGLLGQDFFEGYNYTIREKVIEFRRQEP
ncbi:retropepsin-like aspartic protease [Allocoleopsis sp.]|uniref:retropepsin-like aspartic protease family protein n=1 Tax=Allocoleopsis sp. TaxID=3088169 RepID=UPI002FD2007E